MSYWGVPRLRVMTVRSHMSDLLYVDTSVLISARFSDRFTRWSLQSLAGAKLISSIITEVELTRFVDREKLPRSLANEIIEQLLVVGLNRETIEWAKTATPQVKSLDAIHVGTWLYLKAQGIDSAFVTADRRLAEAASSAGAKVLHPYL